MKKPDIFLVGNDTPFAQQLSFLFQREGFNVLVQPSVAGLLSLLRQRWTPALLIIVLEGQEEELRIIHLLCRGQTQTKFPVIAITQHSSEDLAIAALKAGVTDYFKAPVDETGLLSSVRSCMSPCNSEVQSHRTAAAHPSDLQRPGFALPPMIGEGPTMQALKVYMAKVAATESNTLITGETGTGKELVAAFIHAQSRRAPKPFRPLNCAAIPDSLFESELFGYERGAFTGALQLREGALKNADGGTVFFDEVGDMNPIAQAKILRTIESKEVWRLGGKSGVPIDIRIIAATNRNLEQMMAEEKFRSDLYFRLNVAHIHLPPLRERKEDLPTLCRYYIGELNRQYGREVEGVSEEAFATLLQYDWPGNVRELKNLLEAAFINLPTRHISLVDLPEPFRQRRQAIADLAQDERERLLAALFSTKWNKYQAAQKLHWSRMTLYRKMAKYHIK